MQSQPDAGLIGDAGASARAGVGVGARARDPWHHHRENLRRFVARRIFDRHEAEDIVQEALARAHEARHQLRSPERLPAWLARIATHLIVDHQRARRPTDELPEDLPAPEVEDDPVARLAPCLPAMVDGLPPTYRDALRWSELEGLPQREVAQRLGLSWSGAKSRVQRGRTLLREQVEACCRVLMAGTTIAGFERRAEGGGAECGAARETKREARREARREPQGAAKCGTGPGSGRHADCRNCTGAVASPRAGLRLS